MRLPRTATTLRRRFRDAVQRSLPGRPQPALWWRLAVPALQRQQVRGGHAGCASSSSRSSARNGIGCRRRHRVVRGSDQGRRYEQWDSCRAFQVNQCSDCSQPQTAGHAHHPSPRWDLLRHIARIWSCRRRIDALLLRWTWPSATDRRDKVDRTVGSNDPRRAAAALPCSLCPVRWLDGSKDASCGRASTGCDCRGPPAHRYFYCRRSRSRGGSFGSI